MKTNRSKELIQYVKEILGLEKNLVVTISLLWCGMSDYHSAISSTNPYKPSDCIFEDSKDPHKMLNGST